MNILILSDGFPPVSNAGAENIAYLTAKAYGEMGHEVTVLTINPKLTKGSISELVDCGIRVIQVGFQYRDRLISYVSLYNYPLLKIIKKILDKNNYDLAHIHNIHKYISYGVVGILKSKKMKVILTAHDAMSIDYGKFTQGINPDDLSLNPYVSLKVNPIKTFIKYRTRYNPFRNMFIKYFLSKTDKIIAVSDSLNQLLNVNGIRNIKTIHNGLPKMEIKVQQEQLDDFKSKYKIKETDKILLWSGRISKAKGSEQVLKLMERIAHNRNDIKLFIAGGNLNIPEPIEKHIILSGWLTKEEMMLAYNIADVTLVASVYPDPFPTVVLESMRAGKPVIATCFGGAKEAVIDEQTGYVINPFNIELFYQKVCELLDNKGLYKQMSENSKVVYNHKFTIDICMQNYLNMVDCL